MQAAGFLISFYLLFFFLRDRRLILEWLRDWSPLSEQATAELCRGVRDTIRATLFGVLAVALAKGVLGGLMFSWLALPSPMLWGIVMGLLAVVPILGAYIVWVPAAVALAVQGNWGQRRSSPAGVPSWSEASIISSTHR